MTEAARPCSGHADAHLHEAPYIGIGLALLTVAGFLLAQLLLIGDSRAVWVSTAIVSTLALLGYVLSRSIGLPRSMTTSDLEPSRWAWWRSIFGIVVAIVLLASIAFMPVAASLWTLVIAIQWIRVWGQIGLTRGWSSLSSQ